MIGDFLRLFKDGLLDSLRGFIILHRLDTPPTTSSSAPRAASVEPTPRRKRVLESRREHTGDKKSSPTAAQVPIKQKKSTAFQILACVALNIVIIAFCQLIGLTKLFVHDDESVLHVVWNFLWNIIIFVLFAVIRFFSTLWFADIAGAAFRYKGVTSNAPIDPSRFVSDFIQSALVELIFCIMASMMHSLPVPLLSNVAAFICLSILNSLYSFEYMWMAIRVPMNTRFLNVERQWPYHLGFGTLLTALTYLSSNFVVSSCLFAAFFPIFIVSSFFAELPESPSQVPTFHFFHMAQIVANRVSIIICNLAEPKSHIN